MKNLYSIGEVAKIKEITIKALRYYHQVGILIPNYIDESTGFRYYSIEQFIHIDVIKGCRALGTSIKELQEIFKDKDTLKLVEFLQMKKCEAEENIKKMKEVIKDIDELTDVIMYSRDIVNNEEIQIKFFEERSIVVVPCREVGNLKELIYYSDLDKVIEYNNLNVTMERGIIYKLSLDIKAEPEYVFSKISEKIERPKCISIKTLPKGKYLTLVYSKENEDYRWEKLFKYIKDNNLKVKNIIEIELYDQLFTTETYSCQLQMLIEELN
ncbi:MAG: MerR family transcriptional regulator [Clostridium sp.]|nr:MerR family transcriptional regulator [Clostridium sp.]